MIPRWWRNHGEASWHSTVIFFLETFINRRLRVSAWIDGHAWKYGIQQTFWAFLVAQIVKNLPAMQET